MIEPTERAEERTFHQPDGRTADGAALKPAAKARQGLISGRVMMVLVAGMVLVVVGFIIS
ncbi:MAG: hypothetical protein B7Z15_03065 [Rhizobiales bacterium 32-66-8]|nr:MAG: hypothetical protein B7Z15_03065 [Rhizobiales bacterium 32-66-8]